MEDQLISLEPKNFVMAKLLHNFPVTIAEVHVNYPVAIIFHTVGRT